jgi:hypothetical protein
MFTSKTKRRLDALEEQMAHLLTQLGREEQFEEWKATRGATGGDFGFSGWYQSEEATGPKELS